MTIVYSIQKTVVFSSYSIYHSDTNLNNGKSIQYKLIQLEWEIPFEFIIPHIGFCLLLLIWKRLHLYVELSASTVNKKSICTRATFIWRNSARWTAMFLNATVATIVVALPLHYRAPLYFLRQQGRPAVLPSNLFLWNLYCVHEYPVQTFFFITAVHCSIIFQWISHHQAKLHFETNKMTKICALRKQIKF